MWVTIFLLSRVRSLVHFFLCPFWQRCNNRAFPNVDFCADRKPALKKNEKWKQIKRWNKNTYPKFKAYRLKYNTILKLSQYLSENHPKVVKNSSQLFKIIPKLSQSHPSFLESSQTNFQLGFATSVKLDNKELLGRPKIVP